MISRPSPNAAHTCGTARISSSSADGGGLCPAIWRRDRALRFLLPQRRGPEPSGPRQPHLDAHRFGPAVIRDMQTTTHKKKKGGFPPSCCDRPPPPGCGERSARAAKRGGAWWSCLSRATKRGSRLFPGAKFTTSSSTNTRQTPLPPSLPLPPSCLEADLRDLLPSASPQPLRASAVFR